MEFCICDDILDTMLITDKKLLLFKLKIRSNSMCRLDRISQALSHRHTDTHTHTYIVVCTVATYVAICCV